MKKNVAGQTIGAQMIDASTGGAFTSTVSVVVTGDAGTQGAGSGAVTHEGNGYHSYAPSQAETNYDHVAFTFTGTGAVPATVQVYTTFPQTGDSFARLGAPVGASISADVAGVQSDTNDIQTRLPAALVSGRIDASVGAMASGVLTATAIAADAITDAKVASDVTIASVTGAVGSVTGNVGGNVVGSVGSVTGLTNASIADAVWDEDATGHQTQGTFGQAIGDPGADTDTIWALVNTNLNATISSRLASASYTAPLDAAGTRTAIGMASANLDTQIGTLATASALATVDTVVDAILVDTAEIGAAGAGLTALASQASVNTIDDFLDTEIAAIKAKTDNLPAAPAATGDIPSAATIADAVWDEAIAGHLGAGSTGEALNAAGAAGDPWTTTLPGAYGAGSAGYIIGNNIDAPISTVDTVVDAIKAKTDSLAFTVAGQVDANIQYVNDVQVNGTGTAGNPWGP